MLNKQGPGKIDWTDWSWNPIAGKCKHGCPYCYMHRFWHMAGNPEPHLKAKDLEKIHRVKKAKPGDKIFVGSSTDMWGDWVDNQLIRMVLDTITSLPYTFQFLTKNPTRYADNDLLDYLDNCWFGTTVDGTKRTAGNDHTLVWATSAYCRITRFISFEPLLRPVDPDLFGIQWIIIGADSNKGAEKPPKEWADRLIRKARINNIPVWVKDNYGYPETIKEFPK